MLKSYLSFGVKVFLKFLICLLLAVMTFFSFVFIFSQTATEKLGYQVFIYNDTAESYEFSYDYFYSEGSDERLKEIVADGIEYEQVTIRSEFKGTPYYITMFVAQIFVLAAFIAMVYGTMYRKGDSDKNKVLFKRMKPDVWFGFKSGMFTGGLLFLVYIGLILSKLGVISDNFLGIFSVANYYIYFIVKLIIGDATLTSQLGWLGIILCGLTVLVVPFACQLFYYIGYKQIRLLDKFVYKKK